MWEVETLASFGGCTGDLKAVKMLSQQGVKMKNRIAVALTLAISSAHAQLDRAGNVIEDGGGGSGFGLNGLAFPIVGAGVGLVFNLVKPNIDTKFCVIAGAVIGVVVQMLL